MILYFIQLSTIWTFLLIAFYLFYKNKSYHNVNRCYLILSIFGGILIPLVPKGFFNHDFSLISSGINSIYTLDEFIVSSTRQSGGNLSDYMIGSIAFLYGVLVIKKSSQTIGEFFHFMELTRERQKAGKNVYIKYTDSVDQPFSFINTIVLPKFIVHDLRKKEIIIVHEYTHIKYKHHYDLMILKILEIFLPYHPCLHYFRNELVLIHEYQADEQAIRSSNEEEYSRLLIQFAQKSSMHATIVHSFYFSPIKSRIMMLFKKSSKIQYLYLALIPLLFASCTLLNQDADKDATSSNKIGQFDYEVGVPLPPIVKGDTTITNSNVTLGDSPFLPSFPGGEKELMEFLGRTIEYPRVGKKNGVQGTSYIKFEVYEDGSIHNKEILKSLGSEFDKELYRVVDLMPNWLPPTKDGKKVKTTYTLPVKFKLAD